MKLPGTLEGLERLNLREQMIIGHIIDRRQVIRYHRDQKGDDRCWVDDYLVWGMVKGQADRPPALSFTANMARCRQYYRLRSTTEADPIPPDAILDKRLWDVDLKGILKGMRKYSSSFQLIRLLYDYQILIISHYEPPYKVHTFHTDRMLYSILPEKVPADFRLPPRKEFLHDRGSPCSSCPSFWKSHERCTKPCDLHRWGPCNVGK